MEPKNILIALLIVIGVAFHAFWYLTERRRRQAGPHKPTRASPITSPRGT
jgi:hypothetical protein